MKTKNNNNLYESTFTATSPLNPLDFEKDDDSNGHIDFIASTTVGASLYILLTLVLSFKIC